MLRRLINCRIRSIIIIIIIIIINKKHSQLPSPHKQWDDYIRKKQVINGTLKSGKKGQINSIMEQTIPKWHVQ